MTDIAALFALDPRSYTTQDLDAIITELRSKRHAYNAGNIRAGSTKKISEKAKEIAALDLDIKL